MNFTGKNKKRRIAAAAAAAVAVTLLLILLFPALFSDAKPDSTPAPTPESLSPAPTPEPASSPSPSPSPLPPPSPTPSPAPVPALPEKPDIDPASLHSRFAALGDTEGHVLFEKNADAVLYPASLTKIMTVFTAIEHLPDLDEQITVPASIFPALYEASASRAGFLPGDRASAYELLCGAMLPSGADATIALAMHIAGSEEAFVGLMNEKAQELGLHHTHFENTSGLHHENHYTTARDLLKLLQAAVQNETFYQIITLHRFTTAPNDAHPEGIRMYSTLFSRIGDLNADGFELLGGKTGFTTPAGLCLASIAEKDGKIYLLITCGADGSSKTPQYNIIDAFAVFAAC